LPLRADQLVQLELQRLPIPVLGGLDEEHHQEGDDGGTGVDDELPGIGEVEHRSGDRPDQDDSERRNERPVAAHRVRYTAGEQPEPPVRMLRHPSNMRLLAAGRSRRGSPRRVAPRAPNPAAPRTTRPPSPSSTPRSP